MSGYETRLRNHWLLYRSGELAGMADPDSFFSDLSSQIQAQVEELAEQIAGPTRPGERYVARLGRLREAQMSAASDVLRQILTVEDPQTPWPAPSSWLTGRAGSRRPDPGTPSALQRPSRVG